MKPLLVTVLVLLTSTARATPPDLATQQQAQQAEALVQAKLLQPLARRDDERSRFSRARMPPAERRVRVLTAEVDVDGVAFVRFAIDARGGIKQTWQPGTIVGCVYLERGEVFVDRSAAGIGTSAGTSRADVRHASILLGKKVGPAPASTCVAR